MAFDLPVSGHIQISNDSSLEQIVAQLQVFDKKHFLSLINGERIKYYTNKEASRGDDLEDGSFNDPPKGLKFEGEGVRASGLTEYYFRDPNEDLHSVFSLEAAAFMFPTFKTRLNAQIEKDKLEKEKQ